MRAPFVRLCLAALAAAWTAPPARGQTTLTSGNATFTLKAPPTGESSPAYSDVAFRPDGGTNHLWSQWLFYRVAGDTRERPFGNYTKSGGGSVAMTGNQSPANTMTYGLTETGASGTRFTGTWTIQLQDGAAPGAATVLHSVTITNPATAASDLTISLFHFLDFDLNGSGTGQSATGGLNGMTITDGVVRGTYSPSPTTPATAYLVGSGGTIDPGFLNGSLTDLNNSGLPFGPGDWSGAYQWKDLVIAPGGSFTIQFEMGVSPVPEPGSVFALAAAGLGLVGLRRARLAPRG